MDTLRQILVFGNSEMLGALAAILRVSPLLQVVERHTCKEIILSNPLHPDVILVDAAQVTPEQFGLLIEVCPTILSIDPITYQLTVLPSPNPASPLAEVARVIGILSFALQPA